MFGFSVVVEPLQYVLAIGTTDITDVLTTQWPTVVRSTTQWPTVVRSTARCTKED